MTQIETSRARPAERAEHSLAFDEDGYLLGTESWSPEVAKIIARIEGVDELTPQHWSLIEFIRTYYERFGAVPLMRRVCRAQNLDRAEVYRLFGGCLTAWRIAGLPNPGEEVKAYMS